MNRNNFARRTGSKRNLIALLASSAIFTAGCANMATTAPDVNSLSKGATITGKIHGGNQPVINSAVTLYFAGQGGAATAVATTTSDSNGSFGFDLVTTTPAASNQFACPASGDPLVYVVAKGGDPVGTGTNNNTAAVFLGLYSTCSQISSAKFLNLNEVTTVATLAAVQQYFDPATYSIATDGIAASKAAIVNTVGTIANMVDVTQGTAYTTPSTLNPTSNGVGVSGVTITATPQTTKINLLANILASCVNNALSSATPCTQLFTNATPQNPSFTSRPYHTVFNPAQDVLQALYFILTNPTNGSATNLQNIFNLAPATGAPFQPSLTTQPNDWTLAISYSSISTCGANGGGLINGPYDINIDFFGNLWIANSQLANGNLTELSPNGAPAACLFFGGSSNGGAVLDSVGNVWYASATTSVSPTISRYTPFSNSSITFTLPAAALGVTADGSGNVYFSTPSNTSVYQITNGANLATADPTAIVQISSVVGPTPVRLMPDLTGAVWVSSGSTFVSRIAATASASDPNYLNGFTTTTFPTTAAPSYGIAVTAQNNVYISSQGSNNATYLVGSGTSYAEQSPWPISAPVGGLNGPTSLVIDGARNVWLPNNTANSNSLFSVTQLSSSATSISPSVGFQADTGFLAAGRATVIDQAGNVWVAGDGANFVTEFVGQGVPVYQPYAVGLHNGRFQQIP